MELKITFSNPGNNTVIPIDYQYYLSSWMYKIINDGDAEYATFLHDTGYKVQSTTSNDDKAFESSRVFKLFNFLPSILNLFRNDQIIA